MLLTDSNFFFKIENFLSNWFYKIIELSQINLNYSTTKQDENSIYLSKIKSLKSMTVDFFQEDGMNLDEYLSFEIENFYKLSTNFDISESVYVKIKNFYLLESNKYYLYIYIYNNKQKFVFKMNITLKLLEDQLFISSNNFESQVVPKYKIYLNSNFDLDFIHYGIAVKSKNYLKKIISNDFESIQISEGSNFSVDCFYTVDLFNCLNKKDFYILNLYFKNHLTNLIKKESRVIFFDDIDKLSFPFNVSKSKSLLKPILQIKPHNYLVNLYVKDNENIYNIEYPNLEYLDINYSSQVIVTDTFDNDWFINIKNELNYK